MKEDFLQFLWRSRRFDLKDLRTTENEPLQILSPGEHHQDAGPDFVSAKIQIGKTLWAGSVEVHLKASDWETHRHRLDGHYDNVILHVVFEEDRPAFRPNGERIPCLELHGRIPEKITETYHRLLYSSQFIPCQNLFHTTPELTRDAWLDRLLVERLEQKTQVIRQALEANKQHWEETFYQALARNFGVKINTEPFEWLARATPLLTLARHKNNLFQIEALLFGQAGLLDRDFEDDYPRRLKKEYEFLRKKFTLTPIATPAWKFLRLRPPNFPTIRIAQFAALIFDSAHLFSKILDAEKLPDLERLFEIQLSDYWLDHYVFDKNSKPRPKTLGADTIHLLIINTVAPFLFLYGSMKDLPDLRKRALAFLEALPPESNSIIEGWKDLGLEPESASRTQALLQLKNEWCNPKRCLDCAIGNAILKE